MDFYVSKSDVMESDTRLSCTGSMFIKRIQHATRTISIRLLHLLRANIYRPPKWSIHGHVLIDDILNKTISLVSRVSFHINRLQWSNKVHISESYILNTVTPSMRRNTTSTHPYPQYHSTILYQHILSTITAIRTRGLRFRYNNIIIVKNSKIIDMHSCTTGVNSIRIQREQRDNTFE